MLDKRTRTYKRVSKWTQYTFSGEMVCTMILVFFWCVLMIGIFTKSIKDGQKASPQPAGQTKVLEVSKVEAVENTPTPTSTPKRRYLKYKHMPHYQEIISKLQKLYVNWEDGADLQSYENGFNPYAVNPTSGACGLSQALPCSKMNCKLGDIDCDLNWQKEYISGRYGTVSKTLQFWLIKGWY